MAYAYFQPKRGASRKKRPQAPDDGAWYVGYKDAEGKQVRQRTKCDTKTAAELLARELEAKAQRIRAGLESPTSDITFAEAASRYLETCKGEASYSSKEPRFRHYLVPAFGSRRLRGITPAEIDELLERHRARCSPQTLKHLRNHLRSLFAYAQEKLRVGLPSNPVDAAKSIQVPKGNPRAMELPEFHRLMDHSGRWKMLFLFAAATGLRKGELRRLRWDQLDLERRTVVLTATKTNTRGAVPIHFALVPLLQVAKATSKSELLFPGRDGKERTPTWDATAVLRRRLKLAGIETEYLFKDMRSTAGSFLEETVRDVRAAQQLLRHASVEVTEGHYLKRKAERLLGAVDSVQLLPASHAGLMRDGKTMRASEEKSEESSRLRRPMLYPAELLAPGNSGEFKDTSGAEKRLPDPLSTQKRGLGQAASHAGLTRQLKLVARFWSKVDKNGPTIRPSLGPCWLWIRGLTHNGYGQFAVGRENYRAHRWIYEQTIGPIPRGCEVDHLCRTRKCVRPDHLEAVTGKENTLQNSSSPIEENKMSDTETPWRVGRSVGRTPELAAEVVAAVNSVPPAEVKIDTEHTDWLHARLRENEDLVSELRGKLQSAEERERRLTGVAQLARRVAYRRPHDGNQLDEDLEGLIIAVNQALSAPPVEAPPRVTEADFEAIRKINREAEKSRAEDKALRAELGLEPLTVAEPECVACSGADCPFHSEPRPIKISHCDKAVITSWCECHGGYHPAIILPASLLAEREQEITSLLADNERLREALELTKAALGDRLLAKGPLSKGYAHAVMRDIDAALSGAAPPRPSDSREDR